MIFFTEQFVPELSWATFTLTIAMFIRFAAKRPKIQFVSFTEADSKDVLVVDCSHPTSIQITHHLKAPHQKKLMDLSVRGDTSTDGVLNALVQKQNIVSSFKYVSSNHWDIDSFLSVWCTINSETALEYDQVLRECARIGDFRELRLDESWQNDSLKLVCWLNSAERDLFYKPFESKIMRESGELEMEPKFGYFLKEFENVLHNIEKPEIKNIWEKEYDIVVRQYNDIENNLHERVRSYPDLGLVIVNSPEPLHYYSLFSVSRGYDIVVSIYANNLYEVELKYTSYVDIWSRPCLPRVEMLKLAEYLNTVEDSMEANYIHMSEKLAPNDYRWGANRITDSGPILRLDIVGLKPKKSERYGHPFERPIYKSKIPSARFIAIVVSYFSFAYKDVLPKRDWEWSELHDFNRLIDWNGWKCEEFVDIIEEVE